MASPAAKWDDLVADVSIAKTEAELARALIALEKHPDAKLGRSPRFFEAAYNDFNKRPLKPRSPWIVTTSGLATFGSWVDEYLLNKKNKSLAESNALDAEFTALRDERSKLKAAAAIDAFAPKFNKWLAKQFARRIQEARGPAAAVAADASPPSPGSASSSPASSPVMVPSPDAGGSVAADSDSDPVSGSNSDEEEEEVQSVASSVAGASSAGSAAPDAALVADLARLRLELAASKSKVHELDLARIHANNNASKATADALKRGSELRELDKADKAKAAALEAAARDRAGLQTQIDRLEEEVQAAVREKADLQARLDALTASTDKEKANMRAQLDAFKGSKPGDDSAIVQTLRQQNADLTAQHEADQAQIRLATNKLTSMQTADKESIRRLQAELARMQIAPDDLDVSPAPTESHSRVPSPVNVPKQQRLEPHALYVLLAGLVSA